MRTISRPAVVFGAALALALAPAAAAQDTAALEQKYRHKLEQPFVAYGGWLTDLDQAKRRAAAENKLIFVYFTRSYAP
ncbi:MAG: hypothetical protein D6702_03490 [Planctomycetota bacterium]|nr:MAG: hypothetical protein D6702_03490 [Planctomycetota bacterium]